jgi:hypothetical protein
MVTFRRAIAAIALAATVGCASRAFVRPAGPGVPAPDAATIWNDVSAACRRLTAVQAALGLTGRIRDQRIPGLAGATLYVAATAAGEIGLEARVSAQLVFRLGGRVDRATLYLPGENRVVTGPAAEIVDALVGIRIGPERLLAVLGGCVTRAESIQSGTRYASVIEVSTADATVFIEERRGARMIRAGLADGLSIDYRRSGDAIREIRFQSSPARPAGVAMALEVKQIDFAPTLTPELFSVAVPEDARAMSVEELRTSGLVGEGERPR